MRAAPVRALLMATSLLCATGAWAQAPASAAAPTPAAPSTAAATPNAAPPNASGTATRSDTCVERLPEGKGRPVLSETVAPRGVSGHAHRLRLELTHGPGETVLPGGFQLGSGGDELKALEASHFFIPDPRGSAPPRIERKPVDGGVRTTVDLWFVPLPEKPGRQELTLPPLPIAVARASGEVMTLCTTAHRVLIEDPIANDPAAKPKPNPPGREQIEEWTAAKYVTITAAVALVLGALIALLVMYWRRRPRALPPPPPRRPPWETAMEALYDLRHSGLLGEGRFAEFYDRASDIVRRYLGDRYGYDGLESTTREALHSLRRMALAMDVWVQIQEFMQDADLVKFAKRTPTEAECQGVLERAESLVASTRPAEPAPGAQTPAQVPASTEVEP